METLSALRVKFAKMCRDHDLTYEYSDDGECWRRGDASMDNIREFSKQLPYEDVERIWNAEVDRKISESSRKQFYWRRGK